MTQFDYSSVARDAREAIAEYGRPATIRRVTPIGPAYAPILVPEDHDCLVAARPFRSREIDGTRIQAGDVKAYVSPEGLAIRPTTADTMIIRGVTFAIQNVDTTEPDGTPIVFLVQLRK